MVENWRDMDIVDALRWFASNGELIDKTNDRIAIPRFVLSQAVTRIQELDANLDSVTKQYFSTKE